MEVNRREVPLYGQVEAHVRLRAEAPEDAQLYAVVQGTRLTHVTAATRGDDGLDLRFTVPGHDLVEAASVTPYFFLEGQVKPCEGEASLQYVRDVAQETAEYLSAHRDHLGPRSYLEVTRRFCSWERSADEDPPAAQTEPSEQDAQGSGEAGLRQLDEQITRALANMDYPPQWRDTDRQPREVPELQPGETLLHLAVRLGLLHLARFLIGRPRGQRALTSPNQEGDTPLQLAQRTGAAAMLRLLAAPAGPAADPVPAACCVWADSCRMLRFCSSTDCLVLTVRQGSGGSARDAVMLLRDRLGDRLVLTLISELRADCAADKGSEDEAFSTNEGPRKELHVEEQVLVDSVFEEQLVLSLDDEDDEDEDEDEERLSSLSVSGRGGAQFSQFSQRATEPPLPGVGGGSYGVGGVTRGSTGTDSGLWDSDELPAGDTPPPGPEDSPTLSAADRALARLNRLNSLASGRGSSPSMDCDLSPSLVALEVDSEEDSAEPKSPPSPLSSDADAREALRLSPDVTCARSHMASAAHEPGTKDFGDQGVRLRSYSYSSPKIALRPTRFASEVSPEQRASSISEQSEKRIEEEELDNYNIPVKVESEKYKVIRTFSFLKYRMSSARNKTKGKGKDREAKDRQLNGHRFSSGPCLGPTVCVVCDKPASGKELLHCSSCTAIVHKGCKDAVPPCLKKLHDKYSVTMVKNKTASLPQNFTVRDVPVSTSPPVMTPKEKKDPLSQSTSLPGSFHSSDGRLSESSETEFDVVKATGQSDDLLPTPTSSTSTESSFGEDCVDAFVHSDMSADAVDYKAESWSLIVEHKFCKKQDKQVVKRQDVIYELMQTELHHLQTLHIMAEVFRRGMREEVQLDAEAVERVFPCLDPLLVCHHALFAALKERRHTSAQPHGHRNYLIRRIGDVLLQQFSEENGEKMKQVYGEFCSHHNEAVSFFKELQQHNKRFQNFIKQQGNNSLVRRREIPECILLVTQRITKYPVLLERILQYTQEGTEEHADLSKALAQVREVIAAVDSRVSENERHQKLQDVCSRMENRSSIKLKNGHTFRKQDMMGPGKVLRYQGLLLWKTATGRLKDVMALLLTDALIFLQEKDQKYTFATVDQKPPVIALQKLIVREVANEERGMFLISASAAGPEMYEVHASSKEERNTWMRLIRQAVESCPEEEEEYTSESEEEKRAAEARVQKIYKLQESLTSHDQRICSSLEEKLHAYAALSALGGRTEAAPAEPRLLVQPDPEEPPQAAVLLVAALQEAENLKATLSSKAGLAASSSPDPDTDSLFSASPAPLLETPSDPSEASPEAPEPSESSSTEDLVLQPPSDSNDIDLKVAQSVQNLTQLLYSLQASVTIQDTCYEVQRLLLQEAGRPSPGPQRRHLSSFRGSTLQEQEKQRNLAQQLQDRLQQERERWERECQAKERQQEEQEGELEERERRCRREAERLRQKRAELDEQLEEYQQSLERLREGQRSVEVERQHLESQRMLLQTWMHGRQRSLPAGRPRMVIPLDGQQGPGLSQSRGHVGNGSVFVNEAAFISTGINNRHKRNDPSAHNCLNSLLARSSGRQTPNGPHPQGWGTGTGCLYSPAERTGTHTPTDHSSHSYVGGTCSSTASGADPYPVLPHPGRSQLDLGALVSLETESGGEEGREETIVYL